MEKYNFDAKKEIENICSFVRDYYKANNLKGAVLGISGGKDSAVVAGLMVKALGKENVVGITMPCNSNENDRKDAILVAEKFGFELLNIDLTPAYNAFINEINKLNLAESNSKETLNSDINIKPRMRMSTCYYMAALLSAVRGGTYLVAGTSNACELYVGYFTKGGDSVHDIATIADFTVDEVIAIGEELEVPDQVIHKVPSDGLSNMSDEDKMGVKYKDIGKILRDEEVDQNEFDKIETLHRKSLHKFNIPTYRRKCE